MAEASSENAYFIYVDCLITIEVKKRVDEPYLLVEVSIGHDDHPAQNLVEAHSVSVPFLKFILPDNVSKNLYRAHIVRKLD